MISDISEEYIISFFKVFFYLGDGGSTMLQNLAKIYQATLRHTPEDSNFHSYLRENLKSDKIIKKITGC
jgi:hypothetical protein